MSSLSRGGNKEKCRCCVLPRQRRLKKRRNVHTAPTAAAPVCVPIGRARGCRQRVGCELGTPDACGVINASVALMNSIFKNDLEGHTSCRTSPRPGPRPRPRTPAPRVSARADPLPRAAARERAGTLSPGREVLSLRTF